MKTMIMTGIVLVALMSGCAAPQLQLPQPQNTVTKGFALTNADNLLQIDHSAQFVDPEREIVYAQNFGGSVGLGLLLGPIGVAANVSMIESNTKNDVSSLKGKLPISPVAIFQEEAKKLGVPVASSTAGSELRVKPYLRISKTTETVVHLTAALIVERGNGAEKWTGRYFYQLPGDYTVTKLSKLETADIDAIRGATQLAYSNLLTFISHESSASVQTEKKVLFKSTYLFPRFEISQAGNLIAEEQDLVWIRSPLGVYAIRKAQVTYSARS